MQSNPRTKNEKFDTSSVGAFLQGYGSRVQHGLTSIDDVSLDRAHSAIQSAARSARRIYSIGNGGSAAISDHLCCDWTKGTDAEGHPPIRTHSFATNVSMLTAIANDLSYSKIFSEQLRYYGSAGDVLLAISSSGNSPNIIEAIEIARELRITTIGLSGFDGGQLRTLADISLHVDVRNYGVVEDCHQIIMHVIAQFIASNRDNPS